MRTKGRRIIALLLAHLYLLTVAVPAACALSCPCLDEAHRTHAQLSDCLCYGRPGHQHLNETDDCGHDHGTQIDLYTCGRDEGRPSLHASDRSSAAFPGDDTPSAAPSGSRGDRIPTPPDDCHCETCDTPSALRAPPVRA